jgi:uncharacterized membrane protein YbhN (UPF0104 family)
MADVSDPDAVRAGWRHSLRVFAGSPDERRDRRISDAVTLTPCVVGFVALAWLEEPPFGFARAIAEFLAELPSFLDGLWALLIDLLALAALVIVVAAFAARRNRLGRDLLAAALLAGVVWLIGARIVEGSWPAVWDAIQGAGPPPTWAAPRLSIPIAVVAVAKPHMARPFRRVINLLVTLSVVAIAAIGESSPAGVVAAFLLGIGCAAAVHLVFGTSAGRPTVDDVARALEQLGIRTVELSPAARQPAGLFSLDGVDDAGQTITAKVYGRDARDSQWFASAWRTLWYRDVATPHVTRRQQVEHEALVTLLAAQAGIVTDHVVTATQTPDDDAVLVLRRRGRPLDSPQSGDIVEPARLWAMLERLHRADIAHGRVDLQTLVVDGEECGLVDFRGGSVGLTSDDQWLDRAQLLVTTALLFGTDEAVAAAREALGSERLPVVVSYLQPPALTGALRQELKARDIDLDELRRRCAEVVGAQVPDLVQLRRVTVGSLVRVVLPAIAVYMLLSQLAGIDFEELMDSLRAATWWLIAFGFVFGQVPRLAQSVSTLGASPIRLPYGPVYALQLAVSYINLAIPSTAARVAVNIRFFQRRGLAPGAALAIGALDGFAGFIVQCSILISILLFTSASLDLSFGSSSSSDGDSGTSFVAFVIVVAVVSLAVALIVPKWRRKLLGFTFSTLKDVWAAVRGLRSLRRLGLLFGGNLATEVLFATTLGIFVLAFGYSLGLVDLLFINVVVAMFAGLMPIPGGIGVVEGSLIYLLTEAGTPQEAAFGAVMMYRMATFYLPPIWGYFAFRWLEKTRQI